MRSIAPLLCLSATLAAAQTPAPAPAPTPTPTAPAANGLLQPTSNELTIFARINQYRVYRQQGEFWIDSVILDMSNKLLDTGYQDSSTWVWNKHHYDMVSLPVVLNPALMAVAQATLKNKVKPLDKKMVYFADAFRVAGYTPAGEGAILLGPDMASLRLAFCKAVAHTIGTQDNTSDGKVTQRSVFGAKELLKAQWREAGVAVDESGGKFSLVMVFGHGSAKRYVGGTVFSDLNRNGLWEPGEGKAGVKISCGSATTTSGNTGAWSLALDGDNQTEVVFEYEKSTNKEPLKPGTDTTIINWRIPNLSDLATADKLIADAEPIAKSPDEEKRRKGLAVLLAGTRMSMLDGPRKEKMEALTQPIREDFDALLQKMLAVLAEDPATFKSRTADLKLSWKGSLVAWFKEAETVYQTRQQVNEAINSPAAQRAKLFPALLVQLNKQIAGAIEPKFQEQFQDLIVNIENAPPPPEAPVKPKGK